MKDNRRHERIPSRIRCWCEGEAVTLYARASNLSEGGLFLRTPTQFHTSPRMKVRVALEPDTELSAYVRVVWKQEKSMMEEPGIGLEFETLTEAEKSALRQFIQKRAAQSRRLF